MRLIGRSTESFIISFNPWEVHEHSVHSYQQRRQQVHIDLPLFDIVFPGRGDGHGLTTQNHFLIVERAFLQFCLPPEKSDSRPSVIVFNVPVGSYFQDVACGAFQRQANCS